MCVVQKRSELILKIMKRKLAASISKLTTRQKLLQDNNGYNYYLNELRNTHANSHELNKFIDLLNNASNKDIVKAIELFNKLISYLLVQYNHN